MYSKRAGLVLGFHGCDKLTRDKVICEKGILLEQSKNEYDWLGGGIYFWENNYRRAIDFAHFLKNNPPHNKKQKIKEPAVIGAIIDLGYCLDLLDTENLKLVKEGYKLLKGTNEKYGLSIPENVPLFKDGDLIKRFLDCAVIESIHQFNKDKGKPEFDTVRSVFFEGDDLYENAGFKEKNHIQIAVRNPNCIKGFFIPREIDMKFKKP
jgi:hypothetical protein